MFYQHIQGPHDMLMHDPAGLAGVFFPHRLNNGMMITQVITEGPNPVKKFFCFYGPDCNGITEQASM